MPIYKCTQYQHPTKGNALVRYLKKKQLTKKDLAPQEDGKPSQWRFTTRIATSNKEVDFINKKQLIRFARDHSKPVYFWHVEATGSKGSDGLSTADIADNVRGMTQYFVEGAPCMISKNTYMKHGIANGTAGKMHSLTWEDAKYTPELPCGWIPGQLVHIRQPYSFNVLIPLKKASTGSTKPGGKVIPMIRKSRDFTVVKYNRKTRTPGRRLKCHTHDVVPTFAMTFHKSQGQTMSRVILHLHKHPGRVLKRLEFQGVYVALSRVEFGHHIRVVFDDATGLKHLTMLKRPKYFDLWVNNYCNETGKWIATGMEKMYEVQKKGAERELQQTKNLESLTKAKLVSLTRILDITVGKSSNGSLNKQEYINALYDAWADQKGYKKRSKHTQFLQSPAARPNLTHLSTPSRIRPRVRSTDFSAPRKRKYSSHVTYFNCNSKLRKQLVFGLAKNSSNGSMLYERPLSMCNPHKGNRFTNVNCMCFINATIQLLASSTICGEHCEALSNTVTAVDCKAAKTPVAAIVSYLRTRQGCTNITQGMDDLLQSIVDYDGKAKFNLGSNNCSMEFMTWCLEQIRFIENPKAVTRIVTQQVCLNCNAHVEVENAGITEVPVIGDVIENQEKKAYHVRTQSCWRTDKCIGVTVSSNQIKFREIYIFSDVVFFTWGTHGHDIRLKASMCLTTTTGDPLIFTRGNYELSGFTLFHASNKHYTTYVKYSGIWFHCDDDCVKQEDVDLSKRLQRCVMAIYEKKTGAMFHDSGAQSIHNGLVSTKSIEKVQRKPITHSFPHRRWIWIKVHGDGFCWVYSFLVATGVLSENDFPHGDCPFYPPSENATKFSNYLAKVAFGDREYQEPEFTNGHLDTSGTYGGFSNFCNILHHLRHTFRFFVLDQTRTWIRSAIVVKDHERRLDSSSTTSEVQIVSLCSYQSHDIDTLLFYDWCEGDAKCKYLSMDSVPQASDKYVFGKDTDVVICWASHNHYNALSPAVNHRHTVYESFPTTITN